MMKDARQCSRAIAGLYIALLTLENACFTIDSTLNA